MNSGEGDESIKYSDQFPSSFENYIQHLLTYLAYARIWRKENTFSIGKIFLLSSAVACLLFANVLLVIAEVLMVPGNRDIERLSNTINPLGLHLTGLVKWMYCLYKSKEINELVTNLNRCYMLSKKIDSTSELELSEGQMETACKDSKMWLYAWASVCFYGSVHWCLNALVQRLNNNGIEMSRNDTLVNPSALPFITWQPWSVETDYGYASSFTIQFLGVLSATVGVTCYDSLHVSVFMIICGQLQYLYMSLIDIDFIMDERNAKEKLETKLRYCVDHHNAILKISKDLETFANIPMFIQCLETIIVICLLSFVVSTMEFGSNPETRMKLFSLVEYLSALSVQLYVFCFYASRVYSLSLQITDSVYACGWELAMYNKAEDSNGSKKLSAQMKDLMLLSILRAQRPIIMTGGPFYILSLETFKSVMSLAVSNAVILRQLSER